MKTLTKLALGAGCLLALPPLLLAPGRAPKGKRAPFAGRNFAHRGLYTADQRVPENSLAAFQLAAEAGYGMELDVQLSRDGEVVVFHDETLDRICFVPGRVDELDSAVLCRLPLCGTEETLPRLREVLDLVAGRTPLIVELKTGRRRRELCEKTLKLLRDYPGAACVESFDPRIVAWFRFHAPGLPNGGDGPRHRLFAGPHAAEHRRQAGVHRLPHRTPPPLRAPGRAAGGHARGLDGPQRQGAEGPGRGDL